MSRILIIDTLYEDFLRTVPFDPYSTYEVELRKVLDRKFGTFDAYSKNLRALGWDAIDVIANHVELQNLWARDWEFGNGYAFDVLGAQIEDSDAAVIFLQDLSLMADDPIDMASRIIDDSILAGQLSCPWPGDDIVRQFDILFSSFPHYVPRIEALGVRAVYNPLAFEPSVVDWCFPDVFPATPTETIEMDFGRIHDVVFIGGVGAPSHWRYGMEVLEAVAREIPTFKWWGYGFENLPAGSALRSKCCGTAFGLDMYEILLQSKICLNRHGEVAEGHSNNMRLYEATGCGAMLLTETSLNLSELFSVDESVRYYSPNDAVWLIRKYLKDDAERQEIAAAGQARTLRDHTYAQRMKTVSETLVEMLSCVR